MVLPIIGDLAPLAKGIGTAVTGAAKWVGDQLTGNKGKQERTNAMNQFNTAQQAGAMRFNAEQAEINRQFQERMANTAWQRGIKDMEAAGLNKVAAYQQGPASSPGGATASGSAAQQSSPTDYKTVLQGALDAVGQVASVAKGLL